MFSTLLSSPECFIPLHWNSISSLDSSQSAGILHHSHTLHFTDTQLLIVYIFSVSIHSESWVYFFNEDRMSRADWMRLRSLTVLHVTRVMHISSIHLSICSLALRLLRVVLISSLIQNNRHIKIISVIKVLVIHTNIFGIYLLLENWRSIFVGDSSIYYSNFTFVFQSKWYICCSVYLKITSHIHQRKSM